MTKKQIARTVAFALVVCLLLFVLCDIFEQPDDSYISSRFKLYGNLAEDTLDAVWIGTSGVDRYWIGAKAYEQYGMTVFPMSSDEMAAWIFTDIAKEALKTQSPELLIVDLRAYTQTNDDAAVAETRTRRVLDAMNPFSINRLRIAFKGMEVAHQIDNEKPRFDLSYLLSYIKYHSLLTQEDFSLSSSMTHDECDYMGFFIRDTFTVRAKNIYYAPYYDDYYRDLDALTEQALYDLLDFAEQENVEVLFVNTPGKMTKSANGRANTVCKILEERGVKYINYCVADEENSFAAVPGLKYKTHFYNRNHVNYYGAEIFTDVFAAYLNENYSFADHRNEEAVKEDWDGVYDVIKEKVKSLEQEVAEADK